MRGERGSVLLLVVWTVALLSIWVAGLGSRVMASLALTDRFERQLQAYYTTRDALRQAVTVLREDRTLSSDALNESWANDPARFAQTLPSGMSYTVRARDRLTTSGEEAQYGLVDVERYVNLNTAPEPVLQTAFRHAGGLEDRDAVALAGAVLDWRDADQDRHDDGAEDFYYHGLPQPYECKDGPFENVEELLFVRKMTPSLYARVAPMFTVHGSGRINLNTAGAAVLQALGLSETGIGALEVYRWGEDGELGTSDDHVFASVGNIVPELSSILPAEDVNTLLRWVAADFLDVASSAFEAEIEATTEQSRGRMRAVCVVTRRGRLQAWKEE